MDEKLRKSLKARMQKTIKSLERRFGSDRLRAGDEITFVEDVIHTGSLFVDRLTGVGGIPHGKLIEIFGPESSGKTSFSAYIIAQAQKEGKLCAYIDSEASADPIWFTTLGVDMSLLTHYSPTFIEEAFDLIIELVKADYDLIVFDSLGGTPAKAVYEGQAGDINVAAKARATSKHMQKMTPLNNKHKAAIIYVNQITMDINKSWGDPTDTPGGKAFKHMCHLRLRTNKKFLKENDDTIGEQITIKAIKNKLGGFPGKNAKINLMYGQGFDMRFEILELGVEFGLVAKKGGWYTILTELKEDQDVKELEKHHGADNTILYLKENEDVYKRLEEKVREQFSVKGEGLILKDIEEESEDSEFVDLDDNPQGDDDSF